MRKITAIAIVTIRSAMRSRMFAATALFLIILIISLPFVIKGVGTPESQALIFINYGFGLLMFVLSLTSTWCGAGAISLEVRDRQMQILVTKPLRSVQVWTGKLLGLLTINLLLLVLGGALIYVMLHWTMSCARTLSEPQHDLRREIMTVYRTVLPLKTSDVSEKSVAIGPGESYCWRFDLTRMEGGRADAERGATPILVKFRFITSSFSHASPVAANWRACTEKNHHLLNKIIASSPHMTAYLSVPRPDTESFLELEYLNLQTNPALTVFFPSKDDLYLLIPKSSFESNLLRSLVMGFARLSFFTSLGMLAGALFTFPVAVSASMGLMAIAFSGGLMRQLAERGLWINASPEQFPLFAAILNGMVRGSFQLLTAILPSLDRFDPLAFLPHRSFIPWHLAGESFAVLGILYPLILMLIGAGCLSRREVGLPSQ